MSKKTKDRKLNGAFPVVDREILHCPQCGHDHRSVKLKLMARSILTAADSSTIDDESMTHWGLCTRTGSPILAYVNPHTAMATFPRVNA